MTGGLALTLGWTLAALLLGVVIAAAFLAIRRLLLGRGGGTVECGLRHGPADPCRPGRGRQLRNQRRGHRMPGRPDGGPSPGGNDAAARPPLTAELAMSEAAETGLLAWLEAAPPAQADGLR